MFNCPNCESLMNEGDTCPECEHDDRVGFECECQACLLDEDDQAARDEAYRDDGDDDDAKDI